MVADLAKITATDGVRGTLKQMALRLARAYDEWSGTDLAKLARVNQELRQTLAAVMASDDDDAESDPRLPPPVWHGAESGSSDAG